jgi:hypothetical protein
MLIAGTENLEISSTAASKDKEEAEPLNKEGKTVTTVLSMSQQPQGKALVLTTNSPPPPPQIRPLRLQLPPNTDLVSLPHC